MRRTLLLALFLLWPVSVLAQITPTYTFAAGTIIDPDEANANFALLQNALDRRGGTMAGSFLFTPDNTYDIGASGASRPRDLFLGRNAVVGGNVTISGTLTAGTLSASGGMTLTGHLLFSPDNTYDIGATGATRPRDVWVADDVTLGGELIVGNTGTFGGTVQLAAGSVTDPSWHFAGDVQTGPYRLAAGRIGFASAGVQQIGISGTEANNTTTNSPLAVLTGQSVVSLFLGDGSDTSAYTTADASGDIRFNGVGTQYGDIGYYPAGGDGGHFRFSLTGSAIDSSPDATVGVGNLRLTAGTVSNPSLAGLSDTNTGLYFPSADQLSLVRAGAATLTLTSTGAELLGTSGYVFAGDNDTGMFHNSANSFDLRTAGNTTIQCSSTASDPNCTVGYSMQIGEALATPLYVARTGDDGTLVDLIQDGTSEGTISVSGTTVSYNAFMGSHYTQLQPGQNQPPRGAIVVSTGKLIPNQSGRGERGGEKFVYVSMSQQRNEKAALGVWFASLNRTAEGMSFGDPARQVYQVAGVGLYQMIVTDTCGNIQKGDFLATSPVPGAGERQCYFGGGGYDPVYRDHTVGKALVDVDFSSVTPDRNGVKRVRIPVILLAG